MRELRWSFALAVRIKDVMRAPRIMRRPSAFGTEQSSLVYQRKVSVEARWLYRWGQTVLHLRSDTQTRSSDIHGALQAKFQGPTCAHADSRLQPQSVSNLSDAQKIIYCACTPALAHPMPLHLRFEISDKRGLEITLVMSLCSLLDFDYDEKYKDNEYISSTVQLPAAEGEGRNASGTTAAKVRRWSPSLSTRVATERLIIFITRTRAAKPTERGSDPKLRRDRCLCRALRLAASR